MYPFPKACLEFLVLEGAPLTPGLPCIYRSGAGHVVPFHCLPDVFTAPEACGWQGNVHTWVFGLYFFQFYGVIIDTHHCQFEADSMVIWSTCVM